ncbi:phosphotransferase [Geodermatophilus aquaeductus]|uniref:Phosphotransferase enzyme family protein n=1 Tax=Geodermatophilus aquaeductus TaxID=1564161 RepID=A0A521FLH7_9ACTN|nr:phosphotransferase [Geodermatophilus aquaeductus]SMO96924.1 Phosphotransferase enzyme family protein [Geodermatophilus aquaeductus]
MGTDAPDLTGAATWLDPAWRGPALEWAHERLAAVGRRPAGPPEQVHVRAWSTAIRIPTDDGSAVWLKSVGAGSAQEPPLAAALGGWVPGRVLVPLGADAGRRLLLLPDGGTTLRASGRGSAVEAWEALLADHARLQVEVAAHAAGMVGLGVPDVRPERLPGLVADLLADDDALLTGSSDGLDPAVRERLRGSADEHAELCRALAAGPVPASLQHDDLHDGNVFVAGDGHRFFDWGDASVSHPFLSLLVPLRVAAAVLDLPAGSPVLLRLREAYLRPWQAFGEAAVLRDLADLALRIAPLARALSWHRILLGVHADERAEWQVSVPGWLAEADGPGPPADVGTT